jgi:hypothetical protein
MDPLIQAIDTEKDEWSKFVRLRLYYGLGCLGPTVNTYDGQVIAGQRQGILRLTVT